MTETMSGHYDNPLRQSTPQCYTFKEIFDCLCRVGNIDVGRQSAFHSRLQQLQRLGFPDGVNVGQGKNMQYLRSHLFQISFAFEIVALGLRPRVVIDTTNAVWSILDNYMAKYCKTSDVKFKTLFDTIIVLVSKSVDFAACEGFDVFIENSTSTLDRILDSELNFGKNGFVVINSGRIFKSVEYFSGTPGEEAPALAGRRLEP